MKPPVEDNFDTYQDFLAETEPARPHDGIRCGMCGRDATPSGDCYGCAVDRLRAALMEKIKCYEQWRDEAVSKGDFVVASTWDMVLQNLSELL